MPLIYGPNSIASWTTDDPDVTYHIEVTEKLIEVVPHGDDHISEGSRSLRESSADDSEWKPSSVAGSLEEEEEGLGAWLFDGDNNDNRSAYDASSFIVHDSGQEDLSFSLRSNSTCCGGGAESSPSPVFFAEDEPWAASLSHVVELGLPAESDSTRQLEDLLTAPGRDRACYRPVSDATSETEEPPSSHTGRARDEFVAYTTIATHLEMSDNLGDGNVCSLRTTGQSDGDQPETSLTTPVPLEAEIHAAGDFLEPSDGKLCRAKRKRTESLADPEEIAHASKHRRLSVGIPESEQTAFFHQDVSTRAMHLAAMCEELLQEVHEAIYARELMLNTEHCALRWSQVERPCAEAVWTSTVSSATEIFDVHPLGSRSGHHTCELTERCSALAEQLNSQQSVVVKVTELIVDHLRSIGTLGIAKNFTDEDDHDLQRQAQQERREASETTQKLLAMAEQRYDWSMAYRTQLSVARRYQAKHVLVRQELKKAKEERDGFQKATDVKQQELRESESRVQYHIRQVDLLTYLHEAERRAHLACLDELRMTQSNLEIAATRFALADKSSVSRSFELHQAQGQLSELRQDLMTTSQQRDALKSACDQRDHDLHASQTQVADLQRSLCAVRAQCGKQERESSRYQLQVRDLRRALGEAQSECDQKDEEISALRLEATELRQSLQETRDKRRAEQGIMLAPAKAMVQTGHFERLPSMQEVPAIRAAMGFRLSDAFQHSAVQHDGQIESPRGLWSLEMLKGASHLGVTDSTTVCQHPCPQLLDFS